MLQFYWHQKPIVDIRELLEYLGRHLRFDKSMIFLQGVPESGSTFVAGFVEQEELEMGNRKQFMLLTRWYNICMVNIGTKLIIHIIYIDEDMFGSEDETDTSSGPWKKPVLKWQKIEANNDYGHFFVTFVCKPCDGSNVQTPNFVKFYKCSIKLLIKFKSENDNFYPNFCDIWRNGLELAITYVAKTFYQFCHTFVWVSWVFWLWEFYKKNLLTDILRYGNVCARISVCD